MFKEEKEERLVYLNNMPYIEGSGRARVGSIFIFDSIESGVRTEAGGKSRVVRVQSVDNIDEGKLAYNESVLYGSNLLDDSRLKGKVNANEVYIVVRE